MKLYYYQMAEDPEFCDEMTAENDQEAIANAKQLARNKGCHLSMVYEWPDSEAVGPRTVFNEEDYMNVPADAATCTGMYDRWEG